MDALAAGNSAAAAARDTRKRLGRRRTAQRTKQLTAARKRCADAAEPLRSWIGMVAWGGISLADELAMKNMMTKLRYERRQIDKMLG